MTSNIDRKRFGILPLAAAIIVVAVGAVYVSNSFIWNMLRTDVVSSAEGWGNFLKGRVPNLDKIVQGEQSEHVAAAYLWGRNEYGTIKRYRVYDGEGNERIDSAQSDYLPVGYLATREKNAQAAAVFASGEPRFDFLEGEADGVTTFTAHTFVPLSKYGERFGVLQVISDETARWSALRNEYFGAGAKVLGLILLAFALPGFLYLRRTGQLEFAADRLRQSVDYDALTGTLNRVAFTALLREHFGKRSERGYNVAIHFLDLDRFKNVNDGLGHETGDKVLATTAQRLRRILGTRERLARLGADEFAILQPYYQEMPEVVSKLAEDIARELGRPFVIDGAEVQMGATVGYACAPKDGQTADALIRAADIALAHAKDTSRGGAVAFDQGMEAERIYRQHIEARLRHALSHNEFEVHFQPLFGVDGQVLRGFEALLRLRDDDGSRISPEIFIPIAEEIGLIGAIGHWVLQHSARTACEWPDDLVVSVNLSPIQFQSHDMPKVVRDLLKETGLPARRLELEITESVLIVDTDKVLAALREIKALGVSIALDDFGTGYSSLGYLWSFPFDKLKVDKSFMSDLAVEGSKSREILATIVALGKVLDLKVTAEGVETKEQAEVLQSLDCDLVQGFLYGRPLDADALAALLSERVQKEAMERASQRLQRGAGKTSIVSSLKSA